MLGRAVQVVTVKLAGDAHGICSKWHAGKPWINMWMPCAASPYLPTLEHTWPSGEDLLAPMRSHHSAAQARAGIWKSNPPISIAAFSGDNGKENGNYYTILGLYRNNGKENGNYYSILVSFSFGLAVALEQVAVQSRH